MSLSFDHNKLVEDSKAGLRESTSDQRSSICARDRNAHDPTSRPPSSTSRYGAL
ncbi:hypothetical protein PtA15_4A208 [Puccinia triticina]|uniref:Uncharacterized protein n=1 Tax=Puccinia triticina TaxID=208348 RepID=A0ABY7CG80_9BASI|nr:uncharacterized protein PtA15_4A208 [Puccinia triticina]WAQ83760.1 hypothetical protein PtA15_4A208 [Puccinia triticina]